LVGWLLLVASEMLVDFVDSLMITKENYVTNNRQKDKKTGIMRMERPTGIHTVYAI
jgi:hypothetical protein